MVEVPDFPADDPLIDGRVYQAFWQSLAHWNDDSLYGPKFQKVEAKWRRRKRKPNPYAVLRPSSPDNPSYSLADHVAHAEALHDAEAERGVDEED